MSDPKQKLSDQEIRDAGLDDWRQVLDTIRARFRTGDFATGLGLVDRIGAAAQEADHHPDVTLTYPEVGVTLSSHDVGGITSRDVDLARRISELVSEVGATAEPARVTRVELGLDTADGGRLGPFYAALLGAEVTRGEVVDPSGQAPTVWFQAPDPAHHPVEGEAEQRWHLDVWVPHDEAESRLAAVLAAGGRLVSEEQAPAFWVVADADGNRSCLCTNAGRG